MAGCAGEVIGNWEIAALRDLHYHWGSAYKIRIAGGAWTAAPLTDRTAVLTAETAEALREKVRCDYSRRTRVRLAPAAN